MFALVELARRMLGGSPALLARAGQLAMAQQESCDPYGSVPDDWLLDGPRRGWLILGRSRRRSGAPCFVGVPVMDFIGRSSWIVGASGGGKSYLILAILLAVWAQDACTTVVVDMKDELADLAIEARRGLVGMGLVDLPRPLVIEPFGDRPAPLRLTLPQRGVDPRVQALNLASALEEMLGSDFSFGTTRVFLQMAPLLIEGRHPLTRLARWLQIPAEFQRDAMRSRDPATRDYALRQYPRENRASLRALGGRLEMLLYLPQVRASLESPECFDAAGALEAGVTFVKLGGAPAGCEPAQRLLASLIVGSVTRAVLSRPIREGMRPALVVLDEVQEALRVQENEARHLSRTLSLARFRACSLLMANQTAAQLDRRLLDVIQTNTATQCVFRSNVEEAQVLSRVLPFAPRAETPAEARRRLVQTIAHLGDREYVLWAKRAGVAARLRTPRIDMTALRTFAVRVPPDGEVAPPPAPVPNVIEHHPDTGGVVVGPAGPDASGDFPALG